MKLSTHNVSLIIATTGVLVFFGLYSVDYMSDHESFVESVDARPAPSIAPLPPVSSGVETKASFERDPMAMPVAGSGPNRNSSVRGWLEESRVVNVSAQEALVQLGDGAVYTVRRGDSLLDGRVTVTAINANSVEVRFSEAGADSDQQLERFVLSN